MRREYGNGYYEGDFNEDDERHGYGIYYFEDGNRYEGEWQNGNRHGRGKMIFKSGNIYDGEWEHITNLIMDIYPKIKPGICDSILDNNNNITNFSTQMERACLRNIINVQYYQDN